MEKLWAGRFKSALDGAADDFNASIRVDARMYREDIEGSQAHVRMLGACGIVTEAEAERILRALGEIRAELDDGRLEIDHDLSQREVAEAIHTTQQHYSRIN